MFEIALKLRQIGELEREIHDLTNHIEFVRKSLFNEEKPYSDEHAPLRDKLGTLSVKQLNKISKQRKLVKELVKLSDSELEAVIEYMGGERV